MVFLSPFRRFLASVLAGFRVRKMKFLGLASEYSFWEALKHLFAYGGKRDYEELKQFLEEKYGGKVFLYENGRTALARAVRESLSGEGVVVNGLTCYAVVQGVKEGGGRVEFVDLSEKELSGEVGVNFEISEIEKLAKAGRIKGVVIQNNLGEVVDIRRLKKVVDKYKLVLIEDLAHSGGLFYEDGREVGTVGDITVLSFGKGKFCDVCGGGAVIFRKEKIEGARFTDRLEPSRCSGFGKDFRDRIYPILGWSVRKIFVFSGGLAKKMLASYVRLGVIGRSADGDVDFSKRMGYWQARLLMKKVKKGKFGLKEPIRKYYLVEKRSEVLKELESVGFYGPDFWYEKPVSPERYYRKIGFKEEEYPRAVFVSEHIINLPRGLKGDELKKFEKIIKKYEIKENI